MMHYLPLLVLLTVTATATALAQDLSNARPSAPQCPHTEIDHSDPERYYTKTFHFGPVDKKEFCIELIDREQKKRLGRRLPRCYRVQSDMSTDLTALKADIFAACDDVYRPIRSIQARMPGSTAAYSFDFYRALGELREAGKLQCDESMYRRHPVLDQ